MQDSGTELFTAVAQAPANMQFQSAVFAPQPPSSSPTPSFGSSPTASRTGTASVSSSGSVPPSATATRSMTATPTSSATPFCAPPTASPVPFSQGHLVLLRIGDGRTPLAASNIAREAFIDTVDPATGNIVQTIALPTGPAFFNGTGNGVTASGCTFNAVNLINGIISRSMDGKTVGMVCLPLASGAVPATTGNKTIMILRSDGSLAPVAMMSSYISTGLVMTAGGGATVSTHHLMNLYDDHYIFTASNGAFYMKGESNGPGRAGWGVQMSTTAAAGMEISRDASNGLWVYRYSTAGVIGFFGPNTGNGTLIGGYTNSYTLTGSGTSSTTGHSMHLQDPYTM